MPRKTLKQRKEKYPTENESNRIRSVMDNLNGKESPDEIMAELKSVLSQSGKVPDSGKYYTFVYNPKTSNITYDQHPLVAVTDVFQWGFRGLNYHWGQVRQYTWSEVSGPLYEIYPEELADARELPFQKVRLNS
jgi:hypothetical protein